MCANAHIDLGLHCPLIKSLNAILYIDIQKMFSSDFAALLADLELHCSHTCRHQRYLFSLRGNSIKLNDICTNVTFFIRQQREELKYASSDSL